MDFKALLLILLGGVLANNYALQKFLGVAPLLGHSRHESKITAMGISVTVVMLLTAALAWPVQNFVLAGRFEYLQTLVFTALVLIAVYLVELLIKGLMHKRLGVYFPLIALNSAVLGLALNNAASGYNFLESLIAALGVGLGFWLALFVFSGVLSRIDNKYVPKAFRGLPVALLAAGIVSLALFAF